MANGEEKNYPRHLKGRVKINKKQKISEHRKQGSFLHTNPKQGTPSPRPVPGQLAVVCSLFLGPVGDVLQGKACPVLVGPPLLIVSCLLPGNASNVDGLFEKNSMVKYFASGPTISYCPRERERVVLSCSEAAATVCVFTIQGLPACFTSRSFPFFFLLPSFLFLFVFYFVSFY